MDSIFQAVRTEEFGGWLNVALFVAVLALMAVITTVSNSYQAWLQRRWPGLVRPRVTLAILALCAAFIAIMLAVTPLAEMRKMLPQPAAPQQPVAPVPFLQQMSR